ncbi:MAG: DUF4258 domain-containing protein [Nanoarchaeota archaeon]|nr:DUF4258 domain-containing protein [Nanoarchaeota archaeon]
MYLQVTTLELILTYHAKKRMAGKAINKQQVIETIKKGAKIKQTDGFLARYGYIKVAYKIVKDKYIIKTVMVE